MTLVQRQAALRVVGLLMLGFGTVLGSHHLAVPEAREPVRVLVRELEEVHSAAERRGAATPIRDRVTFSLLHHMADDARSLRDAIDSERQPHQEIVARLAHLMGWFDYLEPRLRASMLGASLWDGWSDARQQMNQVAAIVLGKTNPEIAPGRERRRRLDPSALEKLPVPSDFERVVEQERNVGAIPEASHTGGGRGRPPVPPVELGGESRAVQWNFGVPH